MTEAPSLFAGQWLHLGFAAVVLPLLMLPKSPLYMDPAPATWLGLPLSSWFRVAMLVPVVHTAFVWLCWRLELRYAAISRAVGAKTYYHTFFLLMGLRFLSLLLLAIADHDSVPIPYWLRGAIAAPVAAVAGLTVHDVVKLWGPTLYKSLVRASGADHFDPSFRTKPLVAQGVFGYVPNAMYSCGVQALWLFGLLAASRLALACAAFQVAHIWAHYFGTERIDMEYIYRKSEKKA